jgi:hypothetical protein
MYDGRALSVEATHPTTISSFVSMHQISNVVVDRKIFLLLILDVLSSNLGPTTGCLD